MKRIFYLLCLSLSLALFTSAHAAIIDRNPIGSANNDQGSAINTQSASVLDKGEWWFGIRNDFYNLKPFSDRKLIELAAQSGRDTESDDYSNWTTFSLSYGLTDQFSIGASLPYSRLANVRNGDVVTSDEIEKHNIFQLGNAQGLSDLILYGQLMLFDNEKLQLAGLLTIGSSIPTGNSHVRDNMGNLFPPLDQPGEGTWGPFIGIALTQTIHDDSLSANVLYTKGLVGTQDALFGDTVDYELAYVHNLYESKTNKDFSLDGILEINGEYYPKTIIDGEADPDTGMHIIYFMPGLRISLPKGISPYVSVSVPVFQRVNGIQSEVSYAVTCGIDFIIENNSQNLSQTSSKNVKKTRTKA